MAALEQLTGRRFSDAYVGWMGQIDQSDNSFSYVVGIVTDANAATPAELTSVAVPATRFAVATVTGDEPDIYMQAHDLLDGEVKARHLVYNENVGCSMEWYDERFHPEDTGAVTIDYYEPVMQ